MQSWILRNGSGKNPYSAFQQWAKHQTMDAFPDEFQFKSYHNTSYYNINSEQIKLTLHLGRGPCATPLISRFFQPFFYSESSSHLVVLFTQGGGRHLRWNLVARKLPPKNAVGERVKKWTNTQHFKGFSSSWLKIHPDFLLTKSVWVFVENNISRKSYFTNLGKAWVCLEAAFSYSRCESCGLISAFLSVKLTKIFQVTNRTKPWKNRKVRSSQQRATYFSGSVNPTEPTPN